MIDTKEVQQRAKRRLRAIHRRRRDPRFQRVLGRFVKEGVLLANETVPIHRDSIDVKDVLWAGEIEPRLLELLPAMLVKRPSVFAEPHELPEDLATVVRRLRRNQKPNSFRGIPGEVLYRWLPEVGRKNKLPTRTKSFRLQAEDLELLKALSQELGVTETEVVRRGLRALL